MSNCSQLREIEDGYYTLAEVEDTTETTVEVSDSADNSAEDTVAKVAESPITTSVPAEPEQVDTDARHIVLRLNGNVIRAYDYSDALNKVCENGSYMAKSNIIKELANGKISIETALNRLLIIAYDIENEKLAVWVEHELNGYSDDEDLPQYRKVVCPDIVFTGFRGSMKYTDAPLPIYNIFSKEEDKDYLEHIVNLRIQDSIKALEAVLKDQSSNYFRDLTSMSSNILKRTMINCVSIRQRVAVNVLGNIISTLRTKMIKAMLELEKEYGNLDKLDIDTSSKTKQERESINTTVINYIYNDSSITIGNDNKFKE